MPGTRKDIFASINAWLDDPTAPNIFWLTGSPGAGKSAIASSLVEQLLTQGRLGSFLAFKQGNMNLSDPTAVWRTVASDLARYPAPSQYDDFHSHIRTSLLDVLATQKIDPGSTDIELQFRSLVEEPFRAFVGVDCPVIVLDALDECGQGQSLQWKVLLKTIKQWSTLLPHAKLFITGQSYFSLQAVLGSISQCVTLATGEHVTMDATQDIHAYLEVQIRDNILAFNENLAPDWPGSAILDQLAHKAAGLFIWAKTVLIFLEAGDALSRLELVLSDDNEATGLYSGINQLYSTILEFSFRNATTKELAAFQLIAGTLCTVRSPVDKQTLKHLLPENVASSIFDYIVNQLQPVLLVDQSGHLEFSHFSFVEFLTDDAQKSLPFYIHSLKHDHQIAIQCLKIMNEELKFNLCNLSSSHLSNDRVEGLDTMIATCISGHLFYACIFWGNHLNKDWSEGSSFLSELESLMYKRFLFWLEVLSLTNMVHTAFKSLENAAQLSIVQV